MSVQHDWTNARVVPAERGWYRIWLGNELVAVCPSRRMVTLVLHAAEAEEKLREASARIALLEHTLQLRLKPQIRLPKIFRRGSRG